MLQRVGGEGLETFGQGFGSELIAEDWEMNDAPEVSLEVLAVQAGNVHFPGVTQTFIVDFLAVKDETCN
jgi:hypothetical protein